MCGGKDLLTDLREKLFFSFGYGRKMERADYGQLWHVNDRFG